MNNVEKLCKDMWEKLLKSVDKVWWKSCYVKTIYNLLRKRVSFAEGFKNFSTMIYIEKNKVLSLKYCGFYTVSTVPNTITNI